jgi:hypothetical protein
MTSKIRQLNAFYEQGILTYESYKEKIDALLRSLDWQKRIRYENMSYL